MPTDPAQDAATHADRAIRQAEADRERAKTTAARDEYTNNASGLDGGPYRPADPVTDLEP